MKGMGKYHHMILIKAFYTYFVFFYYLFILDISFIFYVLIKHIFLIKYM